MNPESTPSMVCFHYIFIKEKLRINYHNQPIQINITSIITAMEKRRKENEKVDFNYCWNHFDWFYRL
jgi:hypothetical protein